MHLKAPVGLAALILISGCDGSGITLNPGPGPGPGDDVEIRISFDTDRGWQGGQSDYSTATAPEDVVFLEGADLPDPFTGRGLYSAGTNRSDDLFLYAKKQISGLNPSSQYRLAFELNILTDVSSGCVGVGGAPGEGVTVKAGASPVEPVAIETGGEFRMNIDKGNQVQSGADALAIGNLANSSTDCVDGPFEEKTLSSASTLMVQTDADGALWILFGIDSGFEAGSDLYYVDATITATLL